MKLLNLIYRARHRIKKRYYKKLLSSFNNNLMIYGSTLIIKSPEKIKIGRNCRLNDNVYIHGAGGVTIDDDVTLSANSKIVSWSYDTEEWTNNYLKKDHVGNSIYIGKGTWIGIGAIILHGVKITGKGVVVAAGSIVTTNISEDFVLIGGVPARIIKKYT